MTDGKVHTGVLHKRTSDELQLFDVEGKLVQLPLGQIEQERRIPESLIPTGLHKTVPAEQFADLIGNHNQRPEMLCCWVWTLSRQKTS